MIEVRDLGHAFRGDHWLFRHLSFTVAPARVTAILGANGTGKTTVLRAIGGTITPRESGGITVRGILGHVPQAQNADHAYRVLDMVLLGRSRFLGSFSTPRRSDIATAVACLEEVGLAAFAEQRYDRLSGGQRQLVLLARALATDCTALILDEPVSALDLANQGIVLRLLRRLARERRLAVLFTTHHPEHALALADETLLLLADAAHIIGPTAETMSEENLSRLYGIGVRRLGVQIDAETIEIVVPLHRIGAERPRA
jgi:iron complex transport system ATP-binding protein